MPFDGRVSLVRWALRGSAVAGAGGEALRRAEMREPKCTLNLPIIIGQTPTVLNRESWSKRHRPPIAATETVRFPVVMAGSRVSLFSLAAHINRSFRIDVNAGVIPFGERTAIRFFAPRVAARCVDIVPVSQRAMRFLPQTVR